MRVIIFIVFFLILRLCIYSQPSDIEKIKQQALDTYYENHYLQNLKCPQKEIDDFKTDFIAVTRSIMDKIKKKKTVDDAIYKMAISDYNIMDAIYLNRININALSEYSKNGVDVFDYLIDDPSLGDEFNSQGIAKEFFNFGFIFTATVIDSTHSKESYKRTYGNEELLFSDHYVNYKLKLNKVLKGDYLFDEIPQFINLKALYGSDDYVLNEDYYDKKNNDKYEHIFHNSLEINLHEGSTVLIFINIKVGKIHIDKFINGELAAESTNMIYENSYNSDRHFKYYKSLNDIIRYIEKLEEINHTPNFYNRSYK
jgi:hypothetical protein